jgi:hypothetical protein
MDMSQSVSTSLIASDNSVRSIDVHTAPCLGTCVSGAVTDGVKIAGPFDGTTHRKPQLSDTFRIPGLLAHLLKTLP